MPDVRMTFNADDWARIEAALLADGIVATPATVGDWLRDCIRNVVHRHEENQAYDAMKLAGRNRRDTDSF